MLFLSTGIHTEGSMKDLLAWFGARLKEPSTWRGITLIGTAAGIHISPEMINGIITLGGSIYSLILLVKKDASKI